MWDLQHKEKLKWYQNLTAKGIRVKALERRPTLNDEEALLYDLFNLSEGRPSEIIALNVIYKMDRTRLYEAILACNCIKSSLEKHSYANSNS